MSYLNNQVGYREELLMTRSVVKKENYVLLEPDGLVKNSIPGYEKCDVTILGSPAMGASFADYLITAHAGGKNLHSLDNIRHNNYNISKQQGFPEGG